MSTVEWILIAYAGAGVVFTLRALLQEWLRWDEWWYIPAGIVLWLPILIYCNYLWLKGEL